MRTMLRNKRTFSFCLYKEEIPIIDEYGNDSGERIVSYTPATQMSANVSPASGYAQTEQFGNLENYDKVIVTDWMDCPIDENSVLFLDKPAEYGEAVTIDYTPPQALYGNATATPVTVDVPLYDYTVRRVARGLNSVSIAVRKVSVS